MTGRPAPAVLWQPTPERAAHSWLARFQQDVGIDGDYDALWRWSCDDLDGFWAAVWQFFAVDGSYERVLGRRELPGTEWFPGAEVSYAAHLFRGKPGDRVAIHHASELRPLSTWTWDELRERTAAIAGGLQALGVGRGDRVVAYLPNVPETVAAFLACASLGAVWSSAAPEFGARSVIDRFAQIEPKVLLAVDGYRYGGKEFDRSDEVTRIAAGIPSLERVVRLGYLDGSGWEPGFERPGTAVDPQPLPFDHPLWVLYSSGTTGLPKAMVQSQGGILLEHLKQLHLHVDLHEHDRFFWFTTTGWMMWNFLVGGLLTDAAVVLYDGSPFHPGPDAMWQLAEDAGITVLGTSASFIAASMKAGVEPRRGRALARLSCLASTGSPLPPEGFRWVAEQLGSSTWPFSMSGGTDACTAFVGAVPTLPVYEGEIQAAALGCRVEAWDPHGRSLVGEVGELVITTPLPSMPISFVGDPDGRKLHDAYFSTYPGVWRHGDWIEITERGTSIITGRSDSTINRAGVRIGTSEIYSAVLADPDVVDAVVVDVPRDGEDSWMPLFVVTRPGVALDDTLAARIRRRVREDCSPRHVPNEVIAIPAVPRTLSGKVLEVPVKRILMGEAPERAASRDSLANPEALDWFVAWAAARR
jgi:acetoacetyl-CoA synthetase